MKKIKYGLLFIAMFTITSLSQLNAQAERYIFPHEINEWVECANDGNGENVVGEIKLMAVLNSKGYILHTMGGYAVGDVTGTKYQVVWARNEKEDFDEVGATPYTWVDRYLLFGGGTHFYLKDTYHMVMTPEGELKETHDKTEIICK
jgi:hypothetical protein